jgi:hypothetical protein
MKRSLFTLALFVGLAVSARAQVQGGTIGGTVHDEQGGVSRRLRATTRTAIRRRRSPSRSSTVGSSRRKAAEAAPGRFSSTRNGSST